MARVLIFPLHTGMGRGRDTKFFPPHRWGRARVGGNSGTSYLHFGNADKQPAVPGDRSRFLWEKNSDAALADGSDRG